MTTIFIIINNGRRRNNSSRWFGITSTRTIERTTSEIRLSQFYNTIDVLAHARLDGECNPANVFEAAAHRKPVISHYGKVFNGHMETIQDSGFCVLPDDVDEYARIMKAFIYGVVDYETLSQRAYEQWQTVTPEKMSNLQLGIYKELIDR